MLALSSAYSLQPCTGLSTYSTVRETQIQSFLPSVLSVPEVHRIPEVHRSPEVHRNTMYSHSFPELLQRPSALCSCMRTHALHGAVPTEGNHVNPCGLEHSPCPAIQSQNTLVHGKNFKTVSNSNQSFQPRGGIMSQINTVHNVLYPVLQNSLTSFKVSGNIDSTNREDTSFQKDKIIDDRFTNLKRASEMPSNSVQNEFSLDPRIPNVMVQMTVKETKDTYIDVHTRHENSQYSPSIAKKLRHSIASILNISAGHGGCVVREERFENNASDNSCSIDNTSDDSNSNSDVLVVDNVCDEQGRAGEESYINHMEINRKDNLPKNSEIHSKKTGHIENSEETSGVLTQTQETAASGYFSCGNILDNAESEHLDNFRFLNTNNNNRDCFHKKDLRISHVDTLSFNPREGDTRKRQNTYLTQELTNVTTDRENIIYSSQFDPKTISCLTNVDVLSSIAPSATNPSTVRLSSISASNTLPPIQTLCQPYLRKEADERSAFKPITKLSANLPVVSEFVLSHRNWSCRNYLPQIPPSNLKHENTIRSSFSDMYLPIQNKDKPTACKSKLDAIRTLRQKSSFYQNRGESGFSSNLAAPPTPELLPNTLKTWMSWLRNREVNSIKSNHFDDLTLTRVPPPPRYHCGACNKTYSTFGGLSKHRQFHCAHHVKKEFACKVCSRTYSSLGALKMHIRTHTLPCKCHECGKAFSRPWLLQGHLRTHTGEKPFNCSHCGRAFADRSNLRAHLQTHAEIKRYACIKCGKTFSRMSLLTKHSEGSCPSNTKNK